MEEPINWDAETAKLKEVLQTEPDHAFIPARDLAARSGFPTHGSQRQMRIVIASLIEDEHMPIISHVKGYAIADQKGQIDECLNDLLVRKAGIEKRMKALEEIKQKMV